MAALPGNFVTARFRGIQMTLQNNSIADGHLDTPCIDSGSMPAAFALLFLIALLAAGLAGAVSIAAFVLYAAASAAAFAAYGLDKAAAKRKQRRTPERTLHALSLAGGWPGALIAQSLFRHKTSKQPFRLVFWTTTLLNCAALLAILYFMHAV